MVSVDRTAKGTVRTAVWFLAGLFTCFLVVTVTAQLAWAYHEEVKALSARMAESLAKSGKKTVAVVDFTDLQGNVTELGRFLAEQLSVSLAAEGKDLEVIDRTHLKAILQEHKLSATGLIDPQTARKLGQIAGVEALVTGSITPFGDSVNLSVKVLDTLTARMIGASTADIPKTKTVEELLAKGIGGPNETAGSRAVPEGYEKTGDKAKAAEYRKRAPMSLSTEKLFDMAAQLINASKDSQAEPLLNQVIAADASFAPAYYELGMMYARAGRNAEARANLEKYLELEPNGKDAATAKEMLNYIR